MKALKWLVGHGADLKAADCNGRTALHVAAIGESSEAVEILLDHGADINPVDRNGRTPVRAAAKTMRLGPLIVLIRRGATNGLEPGQWENMFGMAETMLRYAREDYDAAKGRRQYQTWREAALLDNPNDRSSWGCEEKHYLPLIEKRQAVYDLLLQYKPGA